MSNVLTLPDDTLTRFYAKTQTTEPETVLYWTGETYEPTTVICLLWTGAVNESGYGRFYTPDGAFWTPHRLAYTLIHGDIPDGVELDHLCRRPNCLERSHLEAVAPEENHRRRGIHHRLTTETCSKGHPWTPENTGSNGKSRRCAQCNRDRVREWRRTRACA